MKNELKKEFKKDVLLNQFDLSEQDLSEDWFNGFFINPISKTLNLVDSSGNWNKSDLYIGFLEIEKEKPKKGDEDLYYKNLEKEIKNLVLAEWGISSKQKPLYKRFNIKPQKDGNRRYMVVYLTPKKVNKIFDFNVFYSKNEILSGIFDMLMNAYLIQRINKRNSIDFDICLGKIFLNPHVSEDEDHVMVFEYSFKVEDFKLKFILKHQVYSLEKSDITFFDDVCSINNLRYKDKLDAREYTRLFLSCKNYESLRKSKFYTQLEFFKDVVEMLDKYKINYKKTTFKPEYLFNQFPQIKTEINEVNLYIASDEKKEYEDYLISKSIPHDFLEFKKYLETEFKCKVNFTENPSLSLILANKNIPSIYVMFGKKYQNKVVTAINENGKNESFSNVIEPFLKFKLYEKSYIEFISDIERYDVYSQVKLYNLYANTNGLEPVVSQGLIFTSKDKFKKSLITIPRKRLDGNGNGKKVATYPSKNTSCKIQKVITELDIKNNLYTKKTLNFKTRFPDFDNLKINNLKLINMLPNKEGVIYSFTELNNLEGSDLFKVIQNKILIGDSINSLDLAVDWKREFTLSDSVIIINDTYLIRVKDNDLMPFLIIEDGLIGNPDRDVSLLVENSIMMGNSLKAYPTRSNGYNKNLFFPYNLPTWGSLIGKDNVIRNNSSSGYVNCLFNINGNELTAFMTLKDQGLNSTVPKNNRLESIGLFEMKDFIYKKADWVKNEQILYFYLSSITFDYMSVNSITKKSLLTKIGDVVLLN